MYRIKSLYSKQYLTRVEQSDYGIRATWSGEPDSGKPLEFLERGRAWAQANIWGKRGGNIVKVVKMKAPKKWPVEA